MEGKSGRLESKYSEFNLGISVISKQHNTKRYWVRDRGLTMKLPGMLARQ